MARWDWYQATLPAADPAEICSCLLEHFDLSDLAPGRPLNGYEQGAEIRRGEHILATVWWGGNPGTHVKGTGEESPTVRDALEHFTRLPSRVDACEDWLQEGLFDDMAQGLITYAKDNGIAINQQGDWSRGISRTLYLGAPSSPVRLVLYEKGYQCGGDPSWVRLEARVRPHKRAKLLVGQWGPDDAFRASRWLCEALEAIGWEDLRPYSIGTLRRPSDEERARRALVQQYGRVLECWADEIGGWDALGAVLADRISGDETPHLLEAKMRG